LDVEDVHSVAHDGDENRADHRAKDGPDTSKKGDASHDSCGD
jgi:hypothetical protein